MKEKSEHELIEDARIFNILTLKDSYIPSDGVCRLIDKMHNKILNDINESLVSPSIESMSLHGKFEGFGALFAYKPLSGAKLHQFYRKLEEIDSKIIFKSLGYPASHYRYSYLIGCDDCNNSYSYVGATFLDYDRNPIYKSTIYTPSK